MKKEKSASCQEYGTRSQGIYISKPASERETKKFDLMEIHRSLESMSGKKISDMGLFELSICFCMSSEVFREIKSRLELLSDALDAGDIKAAKKAVSKLLAGPQRRGA